MSALAEHMMNAIINSLYTNFIHFDLFVVQSSTAALMSDIEKKRKVDTSSFRSPMKVIQFFEVIRKIVSTKTRCFW